VDDRLFTHEPIVARAPTGEVVVYVTHYPGDASDCPVCNCTDGNSASGGASEPSTRPWVTSSRFCSVASRACVFSALAAAKRSFWW
jgi:hypothetical protein